MKRLIALCYREAMGRWIPILALAFACGGAHAQLITRSLPNDGKLGELVAPRQAYPLLKIGKETLRLAPGGLIFDQHNRTIVHNQLPEAANVLYVLNMTGEVARVYILRPDEVELVKQRASAKK